MNWREPDIPVRYRKLYEQGRKGKAKAAIRCHCLMCVGWEAAEVERCTATGCPLFNLRNKAAQSAVDAPARAKRRQRMLESGVRPPKAARVDGIESHVEGQDLDAAEMREPDSRV